MNRKPIIAGVDTGGTFTDFIFIRDGAVSVDKRPSRPSDPVAVIRAGVAGYLRGLGNAAASGESDRELFRRYGGRLVVIHGTTVPTNALLEGKTAGTCLITNKGFEDVVEIGRQERLDLFTLPARKAAAPVPRELRFGVRQRTLADGSEEVRLSRDEAAAVAKRAARSGAKAAAVCLLYSFLNPRPEERIGKALAKAGLAVSISSRVAPEFREYERTTTTVINASLKPVMEGYLHRLEEAFPGAEILIMCSTGGVAPPAEAAERPVMTILSGPAGGVAGSAALLKDLAAGAGKATKAAGRRAAPRGKSHTFLAEGKAITFDMGGTSTDVALVDGEPLRRHQSSILGLPLLVPSVDIHTVGAGGGSRIWIDRGGALRVGPESTGADPGPACYGKAHLPALTDAHIALGRLDGSGLLGGDFAIDARRSAKALMPLAKKLGVEPGRLCSGVLDVADAVVEKAIRVITLGRGRDPRDYPLVAFGGAGGLHAFRLMLGMGLPGVIIPPNPGVLSAAGIAAAELSEERSLGLLLVLEEDFVARLKEAFGRLEEEWRRERGVQGRIRIVRDVDLRYCGQSFQLTVPFASGRALLKRFHAAHREQYGHCDAAGAVEAVTVRARFVRTRFAGAPALSFAGTFAGSGPQRSRRKSRPEPSGFTRPLPGFGSRALPLYPRESLKPGDVIYGPAVVPEYSATTVVEKGCVLEADDSGCLVGTRK